MSGTTALLTGLSGSSLFGYAAGASVLGGIGSYLDAREQADAYAAYERNARQQAKNEAAQEREKYRKLASSRRAAFGSSGVDVNVGSPLDVLADTEAEGEVSALQLLYGGEREAANWRNRASAARQGGKSALALGIVDGATVGLLGGAKTYPGYKGLPGLE